MAIYNYANDSLSKIDPTTFHTQKILERQNLQKALKQQIDIIAPDTLVIAEEFSEWSDSQRRIDLLAIDKDANLVVIELKRNETGEYMDLQALRYAAMVSTLTFKQATDIYQKYLNANDCEDNAEEKLLEFLEWEIPQEEDFALDVGIVLVSANFSKELTTSVMWLLDRNVDIKCIRMIPYNNEDKVIIDVQQIIPLPEAEDYRVKIKEQAEQRREARKSSRDYTRYKFMGETYNKRKLVLTILHYWFKENNPKTISELYKVFPSEMRRREILIKAETAEESFNNKGIARHFLNDDEILSFPVDGRYAVSNQWSKESIDKFLVYAEKIGYEIEEVSQRKIRVGVDIGEIIEETNVTLNDSAEYRIVRRDSEQIQAFHDGVQVTAKDVLRKVITERGYDIPLHGLTTRTMGKRLLDKLRDE